MSNSTILYLNLISQQIIIYVGFFILIIGLIGHSLNILVFLSLRTFRQNSCSFYLTVMSFINIFHLLVSLVSYIIISGFGINLTNASLFYCKFRPAHVHVCILISYSCMCLATIDQFFATCSRPRWQQWCNIKLARYLLGGISIIWILYGIPFLLYYGHTVPYNTGKITCRIINDIYQKYYTVFHLPILISVIPVTILILFANLAYRSVKQIAYRTIPLVRRELDKQLTIMVLVDVFYNVIVVLPMVILGIINTYFITPTDPLGIAQLNLVTIIVNMTYYFHFVGSFYIYVYASKRFRQQLIYVLFAIHFNHRVANNNQVVPQP